MLKWLEQNEAWDDTEPFDPLCVERSAPIDDAEAAAIESLCRAATPGPMAIDDEAPPDGSVVAILPDGRAIVSLAPRLGLEDAASAVEANAELIRKARFLLLRFVRDRQRWLAEREQLRARVRALEETLDHQAARLRPPGPAPRRAR